MRFDFSKLGRAALKIGGALKKASPEIAIIGGTVGLVVAGVIACKQTPKAQQAVEEHREKIEAVVEAEEKGVTNAGEDYSKEDAQHDKALIFAQDGLKMVKLYAGPIILATVSIASILVGARIFRGRLTTLTSAYAVLESNFSKYRDGVIDKFGQEIDKELRLGLKPAIVEAKTIDENGNEKTELKEVATHTYDGHSQYARIFDESSQFWVKNGGMNLSFLMNKQAWLNDKLKRFPYRVYLNEAYRELDLPESPEGQLVGWRYDPSDPTRDSFIDFGIQELVNDPEKFREYMNDHERSFMLDFNVDGRIVDDAYKDDIKLRNERIKFFQHHN